MSSKLSGRYGVVDDAQNQSRSVFSLKLTDAALNDISEYIKSKPGALTINFRNTDDKGQCQKVEKLNFIRKINIVSREKSNSQAVASHGSSAIYLQNLSMLSHTAQVGIMWPLLAQQETILEHLEHLY